MTKTTGRLEGSFDRMLAKVFCSGKMLNEELLDKGHVVICETFYDESEIGREG